MQFVGLRHTMPKDTLRRARKGKASAGPQPPLRRVPVLAGTGVLLAAIVALALQRRPTTLVAVECAAHDYEPRVGRCTPATCGRAVFEDFASAEDVSRLRELAARGMALGGGSGGPTILDLQSGALSLRDKFIDVWVAFNATRGHPPFSVSDVAVYARTVERVRQRAEQLFGVSGLLLTSPTFFSRIDGDKPPIIANDEYWHTHVDARQYGSFVYTALLYLADADADFDGGRLLFFPPARSERSSLDDDAAPVATVAPRKGTLVLFTSGHEHPHRVSKVERGRRLALTIAFTCDRRAAITDFLGRAVPDDVDGTGQ